MNTETAITPANTDTITFNGGTARLDGATRHYIVDLDGAQAEVDITVRFDRNGERRISITDGTDGGLLTRLVWNHETDEDLIALVVDDLIPSPYR